MRQLSPNRRIVTMGKKLGEERLQDDVDYAVAFTRWLLKPFGIWPTRRCAEKGEMIVTYVLATISFCSMVFLVGPVVARLYVNVSTGEVQSVLSVLPSAIYYILGVTKFWILIVRQEEVTICIEGLKDDWEQISCEIDRRIMKRSARIGRNCTMLCVGLIYGGVLPYDVVLPLLASVGVERENISTPKRLPYPSFYCGVVDDQSSPAYEILFVAQSFISFMMVWMSCGVYSFAAICVMHACGQFQIVGRNLECLAEEENIFAMKKQVASIVEKHVRAFRYADNIENTLNDIFLLEVVGCTIEICFLGFRFIKDVELGETVDSMTHVILIISISFNVFILSFIGQHLNDQSYRLRLVTYFVEWYQLPMEVSKNLILVMVRSNRPARLTAGKLFELSYSSFTDVMKTSLAYLNLVLTLVD